MEKVTIEILMTVEKILLEIEALSLFDLSFDDIIKLKKHLNDIGEITNLYFEIQKDFYRTFGDKEKLKEFQSRINGDMITYNINDAKDLIDKIYNNTENNNIIKIIQKNRFW